MVFFIVIGYIFIGCIGYGIYTGLKNDELMFNVVMTALGAASLSLFALAATWVLTVSASYTLPYEQTTMQPLNDGQFLQETESDDRPALLYQDYNNQIQMVDKELAVIVKDAPAGTAWIDTPQECRYDYWMNNIVWCEVANPNPFDSVIHVPESESIN